MLGLSTPAPHLTPIKPSRIAGISNMDAGTLCDSVTGSLRWLETGQGSDQLPAIQQVCRHVSTVSPEEAGALLVQLRSRRAIVAAAALPGQRRRHWRPLARLAQGHTAFAPISKLSAP